MTSILHDIIKKERNSLKVAKQNRLSVYKKWSAIEKKLNAKKTQISKYKFKTNLMVAKLKNNIATTENASLRPAEVIKDLIFKKRNTKIEYQKSVIIFDGQESDKRKEIQESEETSVALGVTIDNLAREIREKEPFYREVIDQNNKNDTIHHRVKTNLTVRQSKLKSLIKEREKLLASIRALVKTFQALYQERKDTMKSTSDLIKQSREEISLLDGKKYSLLIEKEQFMFSNREIQHSKCMHQSEISRMEKADAQVTDQIEDYGER